MNALFEKFCLPGGTFVGEYDCREDCFMRVYSGFDRNGAEDYIAALSACGFTLLQKRELENNIFAAFGGSVYITVLFTACDSYLRITASTKNQMPALSGNGACFTQNGGKTVFYGFESDQTLIDCGMCLLVQCPDNSFFIVDSGHYFQMNDNDRIHKFMRERTPDGEKIVVNGWFITHAHTDHISKLIDFLKYNCDDVIIEGFYQNLIRADYPTDSDNYEEPQMAQKLFDIFDKTDIPVYKLHTGMRFYIRNLCFDVLNTHEDIFPEAVDDYNDSSCVLMMHAEGSKVFIPGDAAVRASERLEERFTSETLGCDVCQVSHHGHTGLSLHCYELLGADTVIFPVTRIFFEAELARREANRFAVDHASQCFVTGDGTAVVELPYESGRAYALPDETFEDFEKIKRLWKYEYSEERKKELYGLFLANGGDAEKLLLPTSPRGWIEPK